MTEIRVEVEFLGGLDSIFDGQKTHTMVMADGQVLKDLLLQIRDTLIKTPQDLEVFLEGESIRPGIIVLINDTDWELEGEEMYELQNRDLITFTSTLHGG